MPDRLLQTVLLSNGLTLKLWDESRATAGDRWYVGVRAVVAVPLLPGNLEEPLREVVRDLKKEIGETVCYQMLEERHFVPAGEVEKQQKEQIEVFLANNQKYPAHARFAENFIRRSAQEWLIQKDWPAEHRLKLLERLKRPESTRAEIP